MDNTRLKFRPALLHVEVVPFFHGKQYMTLAKNNLTETEKINQEKQNVFQPLLRVVSKMTFKKFYMIN